MSAMDEAQRLRLIVEAVEYCQRAKALGMPSSCYSKALREPIHFLWERRKGPKRRLAEFQSRSVGELDFGSGQLIYDHAVPFKFLQDELLNLPNPSSVGVRSLLQQFSGIVLITKREDQLLTQAGYRSSMPKDWDRQDRLARYRAVGIELVPNPRCHREDDA